MTTWKQLTQADATTRAPQREHEPPDTEPPATPRADGWTSDAARRRELDQTPRRARWLPRRPGWLRGRGP